MRNSPDCRSPKANTPRSPPISEASPNLRTPQPCKRRWAARSHPPAPWKRLLLLLLRLPRSRSQTPSLSGFGILGSDCMWSLGVGEKILQKRRYLIFISSSPSPSSLLLLLSGGRRKEKTGKRFSLNSDSWVCCCVWMWKSRD
ncbi:hypothetical protein AAC387_Pa05g2548 [Persea americana]